MCVMSYIVLYMNSKQSKFNHWKRIYYFFEIPEYQNLEWHGQKRLSSKLQKWKLQSNSKRKRSLVRINILIWFALAKNCTVYSKCVGIFFYLEVIHVHQFSKKKSNKPCLCICICFCLHRVKVTLALISITVMEHVQLKRKIQLLLLPSVDVQSKHLYLFASYFMMKASNFCQLYKMDLCKNVTRAYNQSQIYRIVYWNVI